MTQRRDSYRLYGWEMSLYSGKLRAYLRYKDIPFHERRPHLLDMREIQKRVGARVMPVVRTPEGEWLQDTSHVIDVLEQRFPGVAIVPVTPRQRVAAYLLEAWGDEFWLPAAMHYRWNFPENYPAGFQREGGDNLLPGAPRVLKNWMISKVAGAMSSYLPGLGVVPEQQATIERWTETMCDALDAHFAQHPYLLGTRPSIGDFGLIGPLYAHLGRDPYPARTLIAPRRHLAAWIQRMLHPPEPLSGTFLVDDEVPTSLMPIFASVFGEFWPQLQETLTVMQQETPSAGRNYRRALGAIDIPMAGNRYRLAARPYSVWMAARALDAYTELSPDGRHSVDHWLQGLGATEAIQLRLPRLQRRGLHVYPERTS